MTIYYTPFDPATKQTTGPSEDTCVDTLPEAMEVFGFMELPLTVAERLAVYNGFALSDFVFRLEA